MKISLKKSETGLPSWPDILLSMTRQLLPKNKTLHAKKQRKKKKKTGEKCTVTFGHHHLCPYFYRSLYRVMAVWMWYHSVKSHYDLMFYITLQTSTAAYFPNMCLYLFQISPAPYLLIWKHHLRGPPGSHVLKNLHDSYSMVMVQPLFINFLYNNLSINGTILFYFYR